MLRVSCYMYTSPKPLNPKPLRPKPFLPEYGPKIWKPASFLIISIVEYDPKSCSLSINSYARKLSSTAGI